MSTETPLDRLLARAEEMGVVDGDIDETIHDLFSQRASRVNNGGIEEQLDYLLGSGWNEENVLAKFGEIVGDKEKRDPQLHASEG